MSENINMEEMINESINAEDVKPRGPGRPAVEDGRNVTKCFRLKEETAIQLDALMRYYGEKEGKKPLSIGRTLEILINKEYVKAFPKSYSEKETETAATTIKTPLPEDIVLQEKPKKKRSSKKMLDPYSTDNYNSFPTNDYGIEYDE